MIEELEKLTLTFSDDISHYNKTDDKDTFFNNVKKSIIEKTKEYYHNNNQEILEDLGRLYSMYHYIKFQKDRNDTYNLDQELSLLPPIYTINQKPIRFDIDKELLKNIDISNGLTMDEALNLLRWTANNTRDNLDKFYESMNEDEEVYENTSLQGTCSFGQFSSLYPLQQLGLHITINNMHPTFRENHAFGTVIIPIREGNIITNKRFIIDLTYRQFFQIHQNVISRYLKSESTPNIGLFINFDESNKDFAIELLKNGFVEATDENIKHYFKPFTYKNLDLHHTDKVDQEYEKLDIIDIIENRQREFDWEAEDAIQSGYNLNLPISYGTK